MQKPVVNYAKPLLSSITFLLVLLWSCTAVSKLSDYSNSLASMLSQPVSPDIAHLLTWLVPATELLSVFLLLFNRTHLAGLILSLLLMLAFTLYVALVLGNAFGRIPCSCGGLLQRMSWHTHLYFNLFSLVLIIVALLLKTGRSSLYNLLKKEGRRQKNTSSI